MRLASFSGLPFLLILSSGIYPSGLLVVEGVISQPYLKW